MKNLKLTKIIASTLVVTSIMVLNPIGASASWKQDGSGWWYSNGDSWYTGWKEIDGKWYYFDDNGYMAHDTAVNGYILGSDGARKGEANGIYTWGRDLMHMNFQKNSEYYADYEYSEESANKTITDNLNNVYTNYLTLKQTSHEDGYCYLEFPLNGQYKQFTSLLGLTKEYQESLASGTVKIYLDDVEAYKANLSSGDMLRNVKLDLTGKNKIKFYFCDTEGTEGDGNWTQIGFFNGQFTK